MSNADMHRLWVDDITTIKGTESMNVNVGRDLNLTGAAILSDDLALAVGGDINKKELRDSYYSESMSLGVSASVAVGGNQATEPGTGGKPNQSPGGSASISGSYAQNESNRTVYATIGGLDSDLTSETKTMIGGDFEGSLTVDFRLFSESGRKQIGRELNFSKDLAFIPLETIYETYSQQDKGGTNTLDSLGNKYSTLQDLMFNPKLTAKDLTKDSEKLIAYNGKEVDQSSDASGALGFYDRDKNTSAINVGGSQSNSQLAGSLSHENYHAQVDSQGIAYSQAEENTAHNIGDFTQSRLDAYQSDNTNFQLTLPQVTTDYNNYANGVIFGNNVSPLRDSVIVQNMTKNWDSFGPRWVNPKTGDVSKVPLKDYQLRDPSHRGNDLSAPAGKIINSAFDGKVIASRVAKGYGNTIVVEGRDPDNGQKIWALYGHMQQPSTLKAGDPVMEGQLIGLVGNTGKSQGNHLHFGVNAGNSNGNFDYNKGWINPSEKNYGMYDNLQDTPAYQQGKSQSIIQQNKSQ